jgi:hypothetical protein
MNDQTKNEFYHAGGVLGQGMELTSTQASWCIRSRFVNKHIAMDPTLHAKMGDPRYNGAFGDAFDLFDVSKLGELSRDDLQSGMLKLGEQLTDAEAEQMLKVAKKKDDFVRAMSNAVAATSAAGPAGGAAAGAAAAPAAAAAAGPAGPAGPARPGACVWGLGAVAMRGRCCGSIDPVLSAAAAARASSACDCLRGAARRLVSQRAQPSCSRAAAALHGCGTSSPSPSACLPACLPAGSWPVPQ